MLMQVRFLLAKKKVFPFRYISNSLHIFEILFCNDNFIIRLLKIVNNLDWNYNYLRTNSKIEYPFNETL